METIVLLLICFLVLFSISSDAVQVPLGPVKGRNCTEHAAKLQADGATKLSYTPRCEPDGSYAPVQFNHKLGLKFCVSKEGIMLVSPQRSLDFYADCNCPRRRFEKFQSGNFGGYIHRCDTDFTYAVKQYNPETKITSCMMKNDVIIKEYVGPHVTACKCPRQWYEAKISRLPNRYAPQCNADGTFKAKQCDKGRCWCANGEGEQISKRVPESDVESLTCLEV
ncbi:hypothetical protein RvY_04314-2 [Ramazzottius varieornatus]|nr:hypothetical protein RvY_04314-2 [Ramazzottius varieornatus]